MLQKLSDFMINLSQNKYLKAIRDGLIATLPLTIVGSIFLIIAFPPLPAGNLITEWAKVNATKILLPYRMTMFIMSIYAVIGIGHSLAKSHKLDPLSGSIIALAAFMLTIVPKVVPGVFAIEQMIDGQKAQIIAKAGTKGAIAIQEPLGFVAPMANMGSAGLFVGMIVAILAVEVLRFTKKYNLTIKMPEQVPASVANSFSSLIPLFFVVIIMSTVVYWLNNDLHGLMAKLIGPLVSATDSLWSVLALVILITVFWSFGIHGVSIIGSLARPVWLVLLEQNSASLAAGQVPVNIAPEPFYQWFIWIGGSGATIGLAILLAFRAKSAYGKTLGRTAFVPCLFNINEPIIFGAPIVLNPILIPPFVIAPLINTIIAYAAIQYNMVSPIVVNAPWTLPTPIGAYMATGGDYRAVILTLILIVLSIVIYYPFFKKYDNQLIAEQN